MTESKRVDHWTSGTVYECSEIAGSPQGSPQQMIMSVVKPEGGPAASLKPWQKSLWDQVGLSHCWHDGLVTVQDEARHRRGHNYQSHWGHPCSKTMLTRESRFHINTPLGIEPGTLMMGSKQVDHWTSGTVCECSELAGFPHLYLYIHIYVYMNLICVHSIYIYVCLFRSYSGRLKFWRGKSIARSTSNAYLRHFPMS
jgi:hypothetical protein